MNHLKFGQPSDGIIQIAYIVEDIEATIGHYNATMNVGRWQIRGPFTTSSAIYKGQPVSMSLSIAHAFAGHTMLELIQQHDDTPSVYTDTIARTGYGFHHWGVSCPNYDEKLAALHAAGKAIDYEDKTALGTRVAYVDYRDEMAGFIEYIEMNDIAEARYTKMFTEALLWDKKNPIIRL